MNAGLDFEGNSDRIQDMDIGDAYRAKDTGIYELEYKYAADEISIKKFNEFANKSSPIAFLEVGSWDSYFTNSKQEDFIRLREGPAPELTIKKKTSGSNNFSRIEVDLPLKSSVENKRIVSAWVDLLNYKENFKIYKNCFIYFYDDWNIVYYVVYDQELKEKGRFIEIEIDKKKVAFLGGAEKAMERLKSIEESLSPLGILPANRLRRSMWEMFKKD
jgi:hypothetical protein